MAMRFSGLVVLVGIVASGMVAPSIASAKLKSDFSGFEVLTVGDETVLMLLSPPTTGAEPVRAQAKESVIVSGRLEAMLSHREIDEDTALLLEAEVMELSGARYDLPRKRSEVLNVIGLVSETRNEGRSETGYDAIADEKGETRSDSEWIELIRVHMEKSLSITPACSQFLVSQLGLKPSDAEPVHDLNSSSHVELAPMEGVSSAGISSSGSGSQPGFQAGETTANQN